MIKDAVAQPQQQTSTESNPPDDQSVEYNLVDDVLDVLQNDECKVHGIKLVHPPDMHHIHLLDVLLQDRLNEDIDLQDVIPKTAHLVDFSIVTVRQLKDKQLHLKLHIDGGSNRSVTPDLHLLDNVTEILPYHMLGANSETIALTCTKVGTLKVPCIDNAVLRIHTYFSLIN